MSNILKLASSNTIKEWPMSEDEWRIGCAAWAHDEISKAYMKLPFCQRFVVSHMIKSKELYNKTWRLFYERNSELRHTSSQFNMLFHRKCYVEKPHA